MQGARALFRENEDGAYPTRSHQSGRAGYFDSGFPECASKTARPSCGGTEGSNLLSSSGESANLRSRFRDDAGPAPLRRDLPCTRARPFTAKHALATVNKSLINRFAEPYLGRLCSFRAQLRPRFQLAKVAGDRGRCFKDLPDAHRSGLRGATPAGVCC